jgi:hypothetical protein
MQLKDLSGKRKQLFSMSVKELLRIKGSIWVSLVFDVAVGFGKFGWL